MNSLFGLFASLFISILYHIHYLYIAHELNNYHFGFAIFSVVWIICFLYSFFTHISDKSEHEA